MRLIDADAFVKYMEEKCDPKSQLDPIIFAIVIGALDEQPTAYDISRVVEELEIRVNEANNNCLCEMHENGHTLDFENENGRIKGLKEAIEIVKQVYIWKDVD